MTRARTVRLLATLVVAASLAMTSMASPVLAALANIDIGGGTVANDHLRAATPPQVSPGNVAGFYIWVRNEDTSKLNTFFMKAVTTATPLGAYWSRNEETVKHACTTTDGLQCAFGALESGDVLRITAAFTLPSGTSTNPVNCKPENGAGFGPTTEGSWRCVDFQFASGSGFVPGKNKSRGDLYHWYDFVATDTGSDRGAQFPFCDLSAADPNCSADLLTVFNTAGATRNNPQSTKVTVPNLDEVFDSAYGTTGLAVADNFSFTCPTGTDVVDCANHQTTGTNGFVGQWSDVSVNSEQPFPDDFLHITIQMYGVNPNSVDGVIHLWESPAGTWHEEVIDDRCPSSDGPAEGQTSSCFWASGSGNVATIQVWTHNNGKFGTF